MNRQETLIAALADALAAGRADSGHFLAEHEVTADECRDLIHVVAMVLRGYLRATLDTQHTILLLGATAGGGSLGDAEGARIIADVIERDRLMKRLEEKRRHDPIAR